MNVALSVGDCRPIRIAVLNVHIQPLKLKALSPFPPRPPLRRRAQVTDSRPFQEAVP